MASIASGRSAAPFDQASRLRALVESMSPPPGPAPRPLAPARRVPVVAIASGKGGVGKTSLAVNLSIALAAAGRRIALLDADLGMANADVICGLAPGRRLDAVLRQPGSLDLASCIVRAPGGFLLVPGAVGVARVADLDAASRQRLVTGLMSLEASSDAVLVDTGAGIGRDVLAFAAAADALLVVATPEPTSIADAYGLIKCLVARAARPDALPEILLVANQVRSPAEAEGLTRRLTETCAKFLGVRPRALGAVRYDERVRRAVRDRRPHLLASPRARASRDVAALAGALLASSLIA